MCVFTKDVLRSFCIMTTCEETHLDWIFSQGGRCFCGRVWSSPSVPPHSPPHSWGVYSDTWSVNAFLHSRQFPYAWAAVQHTNTQFPWVFLKWGWIPVFDRTISAIFFQGEALIAQERRVKYYLFNMEVWIHMGLWAIPLKFVSKLLNSYLYTCKPLLRATEQVVITQCTVSVCCSNGGSVWALQTCRGWTQQLDPQCVLLKYASCL